MRGKVAGESPGTIPARLEHKPSSVAIDFDAGMLHCP
jgi:hypothetical protein